MREDVFDMTDDPYLRLEQRFGREFVLFEPLTSFGAALFAVWRIRCATSPKFSCTSMCLRRSSSSCSRTDEGSVSRPYVSNVYKVYEQSQKKA